MFFTFRTFCDAPIGPVTNFAGGERRYNDSKLTDDVRDSAPLKERSRPSVSNITSADVRLTTGLGTATSLANVTKSV